MDKEYRVFRVIRTKTEKIKEPAPTGDCLKIPMDKKGRYRYAVIYYTDRVEVKKISASLQEFIIEDFARLIEFRVFGYNCEYYGIRTEDGWKGRIRSDIEEGAVVPEEDKDKYEVFDELHKVWNRVQRPLWGGEGLLFLRVRNYFTNQGEMKSVDFRFVDFEYKSRCECKEELADV